MKTKQEMKPCPVCGQEAAVFCDHDNTFSPYSQAYCTSPRCSVCGPRKNDDVGAVAAWNDLPRKLTWTDEKPTKPGMYWVHAPSREKTVICEVKEQHGTMCFRLLYDWHGITLLPKDTKWAGPIPMPEGL